MVHNRGNDTVVLGCRAFSKVALNSPSACGSSACVDGADFGVDEWKRSFLRSADGSRVVRCLHGPRFTPCTSVNDVQTGARVGPSMGEAPVGNHLPFPMPPRAYAILRNGEFDLHALESRSSRLQPHLPTGLERSFRWPGLCWSHSFVLKNVRPRVSSVPGISTFAEFNVRTYVVKDGQPGVFFLTLDAKSLVTCVHAPSAYGLAYRYAKARSNVRGRPFNGSHVAQVMVLSWWVHRIPSEQNELQNRIRWSIFCLNGIVSTPSIEGACDEPTSFINRGLSMKERFV